MENPIPMEPAPEIGGPSLVSNEEIFRLILDSALDAFITIDAQGKILNWNKQAESIFGWSKAEAEGKEMMNLIIPPHSRPAHIQGMRRFLATGAGPILNKRIEVAAIRRSGKEFPVELTIVPAKIGEAWLFSACIRDLTEKKAVENRLSIQYEIARILMEARTLHDAALPMLQALLEHTSWDLGILWKSDPAAETLVCAEVAHRSTYPLPVFEARIRRKSFQKDVGLPGRVWAGGRPIWIKALSVGQSFPQSQDAVMAGLRSAFALPVLQGKEILGVFEFYGREISDEDAGMENELIAVSRQVGQFLVRLKIESDLEQIRDSLSLVPGIGIQASMLVGVEGPDVFRCLGVGASGHSTLQFPGNLGVGKRFEEILPADVFSAWLGNAKTVVGDQKPLVLKPGPSGLAGNGGTIEERWIPILDAEGRCTHIFIVARSA